MAKKQKKLVIDSLNVALESGRTVKLSIPEARDLRRELNHLFDNPVDISHSYTLPLTTTEDIS